MKNSARAILLLGLLLGAIQSHCPAAAQDAPPQSLRLLFLGDNGHHQPADRFRRLQGPLGKRRIELTYSDRVEDLNADTLNGYDGLVLYANIDAISPPQAEALLQYVASGKGFIPLHCATYCFRNSPEVVALMGGQFQRHGVGVFSTVVAAPSHPVMQGFSGFRSWDESYIHHLHNEENRTVLEYREEGPQAEGQQREPWTWVRTHGNGRVFYTAWGHDQRTWDHPGFQNLVERGIRWACGDDATKTPAYRDQERFVVPAMVAPRTDVQPFEYLEVGPKIPNYPASSRWGVQEEPLTKMQLPLPPAESLKHYVAPEDFLVELYAAEPDLGGKPIAMTWDERGRLWVCETYDYPNELQPPGKGRDRIRICEDADGDGRADKFTVFAEQLSIPTAITIFRGGAIVQNGTETIYLKDTDGDDRADLRRVLISGWALGDTHGGVSNFQYGLDNWIWAMQGYNNSTPEFPGAKSQSFRMGFFRFRLSQDDPPVVTELEFIRSTDNNTWGLGFSEEGVVFGSTANHNPSVYMPIANRYYERVRGWAPRQLGTIADSHLFRPITEKVRQVDQHGGYTAGAGHSLYTARAWPRTWWNRTAFVCGPTGHLVGVFELRREGADFQSTSPCNLIASDDEWSAPIMAEVGPDGQVWVLDWYNYIVQHNPTPQGFKTGKGNAYESDLRDKKHGRIYRVVYSGSAAGSQAAGLNLRQAADSDLVDALSHPTMLWRKQAQRLLVEQGVDRLGDVLDSLIALCHDPAVDEVGLNVGAIHALWTLQGLGQLESPTHEAFPAAVAALRHPSAGVRRNALAVLPACDPSLRAILSAELTMDPDPQVRLASLLALSDMPSSADAGRAVAQVVLDSGASQRWIGDACTSAAAVHAMGFLEGLAQSKQVDEAALAIVGVVGEHLARGRPTREQLDGVLPLLANAQPEVASALIQGLGRGWAKDHRPGLSGTAEQSLVDAVEAMPAGGRSSLVKFANLLGSKRLESYAQQIRKALGEVVAAEGAIAVRADAAEQLIALDPADDDVVELLLAQVAPQTPPELSAKLLQMLSESTSAKLGPALASRSMTFTPELRSQAIQVLLTRPTTTLAMLNAIEAGQATMDDLRLDQKQALGNHPNADVRQRARRLLASGGGLPDPDRDRVLQETPDLDLHDGRCRGRTIDVQEALRQVPQTSWRRREYRTRPDGYGRASESRAVDAYLGSQPQRRRQLSRVSGRHRRWPSDFRDVGR